MSLRQAQYNDIHSIVMTQEAKSHDQPCMSFHIEGVNYAGVEEHMHMIVILVSFSFGQHSGMFVQRFENYTCSKFCNNFSCLLGHFISPVWLLQ